MNTKLLSVSIIAILLLGTFAALPKAFAQASLNMSPSPINYTTATAFVGMKFNVTVMVHDIANVAGLQVKLGFDPTIINVTRWFEPKSAAYIFTGKTTSALPAPPNDFNFVALGLHSATVMVAVSLFPAPPAQAASSAANAEVVIFEFVVNQLPPKLGSLTTTIAFNAADTYALDADAQDIPLIKTNDVYTITWATPASPHMGFTPGTKVFGPDPPTVVGTTFTEDLVIKGLSAAWFLTGGSFVVNYDSTIISATGFTWAAGMSGTATITEPPGTIAVSFTYAGSAGGDVVVGTVTFTILVQGTAPAPDYVSPLTYSDVLLFDHIGPVPATAAESATITIHALRTMECPWLEVTPATITLGPAPSLGEEFDVSVKITGPPPNYLDAGWTLIGVQFRLFYCDDLLEVVSVTEGPFLTNPAWNLYGTFFVSSVEGDGLGPHVLVGDLLLPNPLTGEWDQTTFPHGQGIVATIRFRAIKQECPNNFTCALTIGSVFGEYFINKNGDYICYSAPHNGLYTMLPFDMPGRVIDLYGGADNRGYWTGYPDPFPAPYGGQGANHWMDIVFPQSEITLHTNITYNYWPVQCKDVGYEIEGPFTKLPNGTLVRNQFTTIWAKFTATTDVNGVATLTYRMPWPCGYAENITGVWIITATGTVADVLIKDTMAFYYERLVYITSVTTDKFYYTHEECIKVTVTYRTHSVQYFPVLFAVVLTDDLGVPFGMALVNVMVGGATFCTWKTGTFTVTICIPKWAYAGYGHVHVSAFDKDPTDGGFAWTPEYAPAPEFQIGPY